MSLGPGWALHPFQIRRHASGNAIALRTLARFLNHKEDRVSRAPINSRLIAFPFRTRTAPAGVAGRAQ